MPLITSKTLYHINSQANMSPYALLKPGDVVTVGGTMNPFFHFYDTYQRTYPVTQDGTVNMIPAIRFLALVSDGTIRPHNLPRDALEIAKHFMMLARELVWESIRLVEFPEEPSRQQCVWLIESMADVERWHKAMRVSHAQVVEVKATGRAHLADQWHLAGDSELLSAWYEKARAYWRGERTATPMMEVLFEGNLEVVRVVAPAEYAPPANATLS